jgi:dTMP kinase
LWDDITSALHILKLTEERKMEGKIIVIDGPDGTGKATTCKLVAKLLEERKPFGDRRIRTVSFPQYDQYWGRLIRDYLDGDSAPMERRVPPEVRDDPMLASLLYAADRRVTCKATIEPGLVNGDIFVLDRYVASNSAHQGAKITDEGVSEFLPLQARLEYEILGIPKADMTIILNLPEAIRIQRTEDRRQAAHQATDQPRGQVSAVDIHEQNLPYMARVADIYRHLSIFAGNFLFECVRDGKELTPDEVAEGVYQMIVQRET